MSLSVRVRVGSDGLFKAWFQSLAIGWLSSRKVHGGRLGVSCRMEWLMVDSMWERSESSVLGLLAFCGGCCVSSSCICCEVSHMASL